MFETGATTKNERRRLTDEGDEGLLEGVPRHLVLALVHVGGGERGEVPLVEGAVAEEVDEVVSHVVAAHHARLRLVRSNMGVT